MGRTAGERRHYAAFYGDAPAGTGTAPASAPQLVVVGNCQAESLRILLEDDDVRAVRIPPIHELTADDVPRLARLLARTDLFVSQPVGADHRGLPLGTEQLAALLPPTARVALVPPVRYHGLHPWHVVVHPPGLTDPDPPLAAYHDLRTVAVALGAGTRRRDDLPVASAAALRTVAEASVVELRRRERLHGTVPAADLFTVPHPGLMRTVNHPGNAVLVPLAARLRTALGLPARPARVDRPLLDAVHAPLETPVVQALGLAAEPRPHWVLHGRSVPEREVAQAHLRFYAARPELAAYLAERYGATLDLLGLGPRG